jgi:hypothetical protein
LTAEYYRVSYGNFRVTDNLAVTPADYDPFCVTAPVDTRLPSGGGYQICGLYDLKRSAFGAVNNLVVQASDFGGMTRVSNGFGININSRFGRGGLLAGGVASGQTVIDNCDIVTKHPEIVVPTSSIFTVASPAATGQFCHATQPWAGQTQVKLSGTYPLPWDTQLSAVFQNIPGFPLLATRPVTNAEIAPSLGRDLSACPTNTGACTATVSVALLEPNTRFEDRLNQLDLRFVKRVRVGTARLQGMLDVYNLFNASTILLVNTNYGSQWLLPTEVLPGRLFKVGVQLDF